MCIKAYLGSLGTNLSEHGNVNDIRWTVAAVSEVGRGCFLRFSAFNVMEFKTDTFDFQIELNAGFGFWLFFSVIILLPMLKKEEKKHCSHYIRDTSTLSLFAVTVNKLRYFIGFNIFSKRLRHFQQALKTIYRTVIYNLFYYFLFFLHIPQWCIRVSGPNLLNLPLCQGWLSMQSHFKGVSSQPTKNTHPCRMWSFWIVPLKYSSTSSYGIVNNYWPSCSVDLLVQYFAPHWNI